MGQPLLAVPQGGQRSRPPAPSVTEVSRQFHFRGTQVARATPRLRPDQHLLPPAQIVAAILAIAGIVMMTYADGFHSHSVIGIALVVGSASTSALYKVRARRGPGRFCGKIAGASAAGAAPRAPRALLTGLRLRLRRAHCRCPPRPDLSASAMTRVLAVDLPSEVSEVVFRRGLGKGQGLRTAAGCSGR